MEKIPKIVREEFNNLRKESSFPIYLKTINGRFYVYKESGKWDKEKKRTKITSEYLGRILSDGIYIKKIISYKDDLEKAKALITLNGGKIIWEEKKEDIESLKQKQEIKTTEIDLKLLTALSMNARLPASRLAEIAGITEQTVYYRIKTLEKALGIKYLLEINIEKLGYIQYLILIKFEGKIPTNEELEKAIADEPRIQFAATTKGEYDVIMYVIDENPLTAHDNLVKLRNKEPLNEYKALWTLTYFAQAYSFMPLTDSFIENVLKEKVWHRTNETSYPDKTQIKYREFILLKELNNHSINNFVAIDTKHKFNTGTSRYTYHSLKEKGIIVRPTISMTDIRQKYVGVILISNIYYKKIQENRYKLLLDTIEYDKITNKYSITGNIGAPSNGAIMFLPVTEEGYLEKTAMSIENGLQGSTTKSLVITSIMTGALCYRRFDNTYSRQYQLLVEFKKTVQEKLMSYE